MTILLLKSFWERIGELLAITVAGGATHLLTDSSRSIITVLPGNPLTHGLLPVPLLERTFLLPALELHGLLTGHIHQDRLGLLTMIDLEVCALEVISSVHIHLEGCVTHPLLHSGTHLHQVILLDCEVIHLLLQTTDQLLHIKAFPLSLSLHNPSAVVEFLHHTSLLHLSVASLCLVRNTLVHKLHPLLVPTLHCVLTNQTVTRGNPPWHCKHPQQTLRGP